MNDIFVYDFIAASTELLKLKPRVMTKLGKIMLLVISILRYLEFKSHDHIEILFQFFLYHCFCLRPWYPFDEIILFLKNRSIFQ